MEKGIWLSYDLGVGGDYKAFFAWLDDHNAILCGANQAFLKYQWDLDDDTASVEALRNDILSKVNIEPRNSIYIVRAKNKEGDKKAVGSFLFGKRMAAPWEGYGSSDSDVAEEG